ncbi:hypothetical protein HDV00_009250 [Rhizophlyctis rosea]|nr:hypothetical protein HDV00_009250 [Rhizophlyctis rosea]
MKLATSFAVAAAALALSAPAVDAQYVKASGTGFTLNGSSFRFHGTNCYWCSFLTNDNDIATTYKAIAASGMKVVRIWGWNDVTSASGVYYQLWQGSTATVNTGNTGLGRLDANVKAAGSAGLKLVIPMTNNWGDYGGMDVYVKALGGSGHSAFYTNTAIVNAYKNYVRQVVSRYTTDTAIMSWQLANEPRCAGCPASTITNWASTMSSYIKSLDSNHLVSLGDEGFFNRASGGYAYQGGEGVDFEANLKISTLDYGVMHFYPDSWSLNPTTGAQWAKDHADAGKAVGKPVVWEEYGYKTNRGQYLPAWQSAALSNGLAGTQYWQFGLTLSTGQTHNDGYTIYNTDSDFNTLVVQHAAAMSGGSVPTNPTTTRATTTTTGTQPTQGSGSCTDVAPSSDYTCAQQAVL